MICNRCGAQLPDGCSVCSACGNVLSPQPAQPATSQTEQVPSAVPNEVPNMEYFAQAEFEQNKTKKKKSKKGLLIGILAGLVAIAGAVWLFFFSPFFQDNEIVSNIKGDYIKNHGTSDEYAQYVENKTLSGYVDSASSVYGNILSSMGNGQQSADVAAKVQVDIVASEDAIELLERLLRERSGESVELDWINSASIMMDGNSKGMMSQVGMQLMLDGQVLADMDMIYDLENYVYYVAILNLSDKYLSQSVALDAESMADMDDMRKLLAGMQEHLPTEQQFEALLEKYLDIVVKNISETSKSEETLEIGGISQKVTVVEYSLDTDTLATVLRAVLETAKNDEELAGYIRNVAEYLEDEGKIEDADAVYDSFRDGIRDMIDDIKDADTENSKVMTIVNYVDDSHRVIGRSFRPQGGEPISYVTLHDGEKFATLIELSSLMKIEGEGSDKDGTVNAEYKVKYNNALMCNIELIDCNGAKGDQGGFNGTLRITPSSTLLKEMDVDPSAAAIISAAGFSLELKAASDDNQMKFEMNIISGGKTFFGVHMSVTPESAQEVVIPSADKVIDSANAEEWANTLDLTKLLDALKKTTMPEQIVSMLEMMLSESAPQQ